MVVFHILSPSLHSLCYPSQVWPVPSCPPWALSVISAHYCWNGYMCRYVHRYQRRWEELCTVDSGSFIPEAIIEDGGCEMRL